MSCKHCPYNLKAEKCKDGRACIRGECRAALIMGVVFLAVGVFGCIFGFEEVCNIGLIGVLVALAGGIGTFFHWLSFYLAERPHDPSEGD